MPFYLGKRPQGNWVLFSSLALQRRRRTAISTPARKVHSGPPGRPLVQPLRLGQTPMYTRWRTLNGLPAKRPATTWLSSNGCSKKT